MGYQCSLIGMALRCALLVLLLLTPLRAQTWQLIWSDEFNGPANTLPDAGKWGYDLGGGGFGNGELETYTTAPENASLDGNGNLLIRTLRPSSNSYTSARIKTQDKFSIAYGKIEARIKIPFGQGIWPAFWMLGANIPSVSWPNCGEIDIMENIGKEPAIVHGTVHGPGYSGANGLGKGYSLPGGARFADDFHLYTVVWSPGAVEFQVDGNAYFKVTPASLPAGAKWVFTKPFFLLLNVAVGGGWPGYPDATTTFPQIMAVDYVRVYRSSTEAVINPGGVVDAASFAAQLTPGSLATVFGTGLADDVYGSLFDTTQNAFSSSVAGVSVQVEGHAAPLTFVSPNQINFQVPWQTPMGPATAGVQVIRNSLPSNTETLTLTPTAPSVFELPPSAWFTPSGPGTAIVTCSGVNCTLWGNGFGSPAQRDGAPAPLAYTDAACTLQIENKPATVTYCGTAPGLIIDQLNFTYPAGLPANATVLNASLQVGAASSRFQVPPPPAP